MDFGLNLEQKRTILLSVKESHMNELFTLLIRAGIDPDTFDATTTLPEDDMAMYGERIRIEKLLTAISLVDTKLNELEV